MMFQVMLFSMLHYSISQSNNSIFVHQRILSCLIVYDSPHPFAAASTSPFSAFLWILWCVVTMEMGPSWMVFLLWFRSQRPSGTPSSQKCRRMKSGGRTLETEVRTVTKSQMMEAS